MTPPSAARRCKLVPGQYRRSCFACTLSDVVSASEASALIQASERQRDCAVRRGRPINAAESGNASRARSVASTRTQSFDPTRRAGEEIGYAAAALNTSGEHPSRASRTSDQCVVDDADLAARLFERLSRALPQSLRGRALVGLHPTLRFDRYQRGGYFKPHQDKSRADASGNVSLVTCLLHLNDDFVGGKETLFSTASFHVVDPAVGMALVLSHEITHEAAAVRDGTKYVLRADVMYGPRHAKPPRPPAAPARARPDAPL